MISSRAQQNSVRWVVGGLGALAFLALGKVGFCVWVLCALPRAENSLGSIGKVMLG